MTADTTSRPATDTKGSGKRTGYAHRTLGFGVPATSDPHHFVVRIPRGNSAAVLISEHLGMGSETAREQVIDRVLLERPRWTAIRARASSPRARQVGSSAARRRRRCRSASSCSPASAVAATDSPRWANGSPSR